jgi:O-antigen/teichoic acid export membrane protein
MAVIYQLRFANHTFGPSYGGLIALLNQITFYILLAELGLAAATTSLLFEPAHRGDQQRVKALVQALQFDVRRIVNCLAPISCLATTALSFWLRRQIPVVPLSLSLFLTCASALITFMALPYQSHFNATDRVPTRNVILGCGFALKVTVGILLAKAMHSFVGLTLGTLIVGVAELMIQRRLVLPCLGSEGISHAMLADARKSIRNRARFVLAHRIGYLFCYQSDYIILLLSSSLSLLGYYAQYQYIYAGLLSFSIAVGGTLTARIAKRQIDLGQELFPAFYRKTALLTSTAAIICGAGFYLFADPAILVLYRTTNYDHNVVTLFSILLMLNIVKMNDDLWIDTTGAYQKAFYLPILEASTYVVLGLFLVRHLHMAGILYAGIVTNLLFSVVFKSFVIGGGVMKREVVSTSLVKVSSVIGIGVVFYLLVTTLHLLSGRI